MSIALPPIETHLELLQPRSARGSRDDISLPDIAQAPATARPRPPKPSRRISAFQHDATKALNRQRIISSLQHDATNALRRQMPRWWHPPDGVQKAADEFDEGLGIVQKRVNKLDLKSTSCNLQDDFELTLQSVRAVRYRVQPLRMGRKDEMLRRPDPCVRSAVF